jgi:hypothetical protein
MVLHSAKIVHRRKKRRSKIGDGKKKFFFESPFSPRTNIFFEFVLLVSNVKLCEICDKKRKKLQKSFSHGKTDCKVLIGYTFCVGYTYRADCNNSLLLT